jgi:hypothetical protein
MMEGGGGGLCYERCRVTLLGGWRWRWGECQDDGFPVWGIFGAWLFGGVLYSMLARRGNVECNGKFRGDDGLDVVRVCGGWTGKKGRSWEQRHCCRGIL